MHQYKNLPFGPGGTNGPSPFSPLSPFGPIGPLAPSFWPLRFYLKYTHDALNILIYLQLYLNVFFYSPLNT